MYNHDILTSLGFDVPRTTNELIAVCKAIYDLNGSNSAYTNKYSIAVSVERAEANYWEGIIFPLWWAQYEGIEGYENIVSLMKTHGINLPIVAIGGITYDDIPRIMSTGVTGIAISGSVLRADNPVEEMKRIAIQLRKGVKE